MRPRCCSTSSMPGRCSGRELDVQLASVTEQWAQFAIAGPRSRELLERLLGDALDLSNAAFPVSRLRGVSWQGRPARLFRISFSGELAYELAVPARGGDAAVRAIMRPASRLAVVPYGMEALGTMRIEKGHVAGAELNGTTTAHDLGLGKHAVGAEGLYRPGARRPAGLMRAGSAGAGRCEALEAGRKAHGWRPFPADRRAAEPGERRGLHQLCRLSRPPSGTGSGSAS